MKVTTGFSQPYMAKYKNEGGVVSYTDGKKVGRGVDVSISPESSDSSTFYADNSKAEDVPGTFTGGRQRLPSMDWSRKQRRWLAEPEK